MKYDFIINQRKKYFDLTDFRFILDHKPYSCKQVSCQVSVSCQPGLGDHDVVIAHCALKPTVERQKPRKVAVFRKADWPKFKSLMTDYQQKFLSSHIGKSIEELWNDFTLTLGLFTSQCIPVSLFLVRNHCLGLLKKLGAKFENEII